MNSRNNEEYKIRIIPDNFGNGVNILGMHFKALFLIEGIVLAVIMLIVSLIVLRALGMNDIGEMLGICLVFSGIALFVGIKGINDEPITTFLKNFSDFNKKKRTAYYNPRVKLEAKSVKMEKQDKENKDAIPREKILAFFNKYKETLDKKQQEKVKAFEEKNSFDANNMFFEDDIGIIKRPNSYMSEKEADEYDKKKAKMKKFKEKI